MKPLDGRTPGLTAIGILLAAFGTGCTTGAKDDAAATAVEITVRPQVVSLHAGEAVQLAVQVNDAKGRAIGEAPIAFAADTSSIVRISPLGLLSAVGPAGEDSIRISSGALTRTVAVTVRAGPPSVLSLSPNGPQSGLAGAALATPIVVTVRDAYGNTVPRASVHFNTEAGGDAAPAVVTSDAAGVARTMWTLGPLAGTQSLQVIADSASVVAEAFARPGAMAAVQNINPISRRTHAGDTIAMRLRSIDAFGNGVAGVVFAFSISDGRGDVVPARVESDSTGIASTLWRTATTSGANSLRVRAFQATDTSFLINVRTIGGTPVQLELVSGDRQSAKTLTAVRRPPVVRVVDQFGNPVSAIRIRFSTSEEAATLEPMELVTDDKGLATIRRWTLGVVGDQTLNVLADGIADTLRIRARATAR